VTARPDPAAAALDPAGRCAGTAGPAEPTTGPPEAGRLDRIVVEQALEVAVKPSQFELIVHDLAKYPDAPLSAADAQELIGLIEQARSISAALEAECAALTDALSEGRHEFDGRDTAVVTAAGEDVVMAVCVATCDGQRCRRSTSHPVHRTPARVRAELEER
jgi:hypothetical protein